jgi:hypothetical protein
VCAGGWVSGAHRRGVVDMHTYYNDNVTGEPRWVDTTSQTITLNSADIVTSGGTRLFWWGNNEVNHCRVDSITGPVLCSVANRSRVTFYGPDFVHSGTHYTRI